LRACEANKEDTTALNQKITELRAELNSCEKDFDESVEETQTCERESDKLKIASSHCSE